MGKKYKIGGLRNNRGRLTESVWDAIRAPTEVFRRDRGRDIWALKDVSMEIDEGEVIGIIGRNGAGKTTLLKILSRITEPTEGLAYLNGRVGSLLEIGTGFHPDLTGRENIHLNGAILGMRRDEIKKRFDEIVAFSEVEKFIDTPVKRYSSGMQVRLAFAVAAHLETEVLIVDEVLAVGDAAFQKKCLGKMEDVSQAGRTVLLVSHNMAAVENMCTRAVVLEAGRILIDDTPPRAIDHYLKTVLPEVVGGGDLRSRDDRSGSGRLRMVRFNLEDSSGTPVSTARSGSNVRFVLHYQAEQELRSVDVGISVETLAGQTLFVLYSSYLGQTIASAPRTGSLVLEVERLPLAPGRYVVGSRILVGGEEADWLRNGVGFLDVESGDFYRTGHPGFGSTAPILVSGDYSVRDETY